MERDGLLESVMFSWSSTVYYICAVDWTVSQRQVIDWAEKTNIELQAWPYRVMGRYQRENCIEIDIKLSRKNEGIYFPIFTNLFHLVSIEFSESVDWLIVWLIKYM